MCLGELHVRVMKPGARLSILGGAMPDGFDPAQERHRQLLLETREATGLGCFNYDRCEGNSSIGLEKCSFIS